MSAPGRSGDGLKPITVVGGGLAGLSLGLLLKRRGIPVTVCEAGHYPRHRVCGEFICGRGVEVLRELKLTPPLESVLAHTAQFFFSRVATPVRFLPMPAVCISRQILDAVLARQFREAGGDLREGERWAKQEGGEGVVQASGRRVQTVEEGWRWFGVKAHARGVTLSADLEMHVQRDGYVGLARLDKETVNVCGLFRRSVADHKAAVPWREMLLGAAGEKLHEHLEEADWDEESFCSVAGLPVFGRLALEPGECRIGDALAMIAPVTGNGMSMAFESAVLTVEPLAEYSHGRVSWAEACRAVAQACEKALGPRLAWGRRLQRMMFSPLLRGRWAWLPLQSAGLWRMVFERTR